MINRFDIKIWSKSWLVTYKVFEVTLDGELIFSKKTLERFPNPGEVENLIQDKQ